MEYSKRFSGNDELRMRFTVWLKIVVKRVKIDYIRRQKKRYIEVSIEEAAITNTLTYEQQFDINENSNKFIFEIVEFLQHSTSYRRNEKKFSRCCLYAI